MEKLFNDTKVAFAIKSDSELDRAFYLFEMIKREPLVKIGAAVTKFLPLRSAVLRAPMLQRRK